MFVITKMLEMPGQMRVMLLNSAWFMLRGALFESAKNFLVYERSYQPD